jgi:hypothetical protein
MCTRQSAFASIAQGKSLVQITGDLSMHYDLPIGHGFTELLKSCVRFEVFTAVTMKNVAFWDFNAVWLL